MQAQGMGCYARVRHASVPLILHNSPPLFVTCVPKRHFYTVALGFTIKRQRHQLVLSLSASQVFAMFWFRDEQCMSMDEELQPLIDAGNPEEKQDEVYAFDTEEDQKEEACGDELQCLSYNSSYCSDFTIDLMLEADNQEVNEAKTYNPFNVLPLYPNREDQYIMSCLEIKTARNALQNIKGLAWPKDQYETPTKDLLDWLQVTFGFQKDNASNQREHLIHLLANVQMRLAPCCNQEEKLDELALTEVMKKLFKNYKKWCKYINRKSNIWLPTIYQEVQQLKLLYIGLYLLIWGEAANLRFMPECLCYIFHHMAFELYGLLAGKVSLLNDENTKPAYGNDEEAFLKKVITPLYQVVAKEVERSKREQSRHSQWRNYDDLNEYFWSVDCFHLGWPMRLGADFFCVSSSHNQKQKDKKQATKSQWIGKSNFVEIRSFGLIFQSFCRMWIFSVLCLQAMIIIAWDGRTLSQIFDVEVSKKVLSIFLTASVLQLVKAVLDVIFSWKARRSMTFVVKLRYTLKVFSAIAWVMTLHVTYFMNLGNYMGTTTIIKQLIGDGENNFSLYIFAVIIFLLPDMLAPLLFLLPWLRHFFDGSRYKIIKVVMWWSEPLLYVGRDMHESPFSFFKYAIFWVLLMVTKITFSYYIEIKPLVGPTKHIMREPIRTFQLHGNFHQDNKNVAVVIVLWAPIVLFYFMDTQIWYSIFSTLVGGTYGAFCRLGEIRSLNMLRSRFHSLPDAVSSHLIPLTKFQTSSLKSLQDSLKGNNNETLTDRQMAAARFSQIWNKIINSFREEDLMSDRERDMLLIPYYVDQSLDLPQWPLFLLGDKILTAIDMAKDCNKNIPEVKKRICTDIYMHSAICECYISLRSTMKYLVDSPLEEDVIDTIFSMVDGYIAEDTLLSSLDLSYLPVLYDKLVELIKLLINNKLEDKNQVITLFQGMLQVVTRDIIEVLPCFENFIHEDSYKHHKGIKLSDQHLHFFTQAGSVKFPLPESGSWQEKIKRFYLLLTAEGSGTDVPSNLEARSVLTPYYNEDVIYSLESLKDSNEDGVSILSYLQKIYPDEWRNFLERVGCNVEEELHLHKDLKNELRLWASYRGQTLARTVRGMMYYQKALQFQAFLDMASDEDLMEGYRAEKLKDEDHLTSRSLSMQCQAIADMKFTYVLSCQHFGIQKRSGDPCARDILMLMKRYPSLRVAYIDEIEEPKKYGNRRKEKCCYSKLAKVSLDKADDSAEPELEVIYRIKLPGPAILGEGKPENQNHAIIFTRGESLQTIDMNQEHYIEEALKMRNLLQEFLKKRHNGRFPSIIGVREHIFTGSVSSLAWFMSNQETNFVTIGQRVLANPLRVRFHYGHPDVFDRLFHLTRGGVSKASKKINLSEDIFAGFNSILREGNITHHEYMQVGKGRDVGFNQISIFEAKIANGNGEQTISRDIYRLGHGFDFFRMLSCYFTTVGFYFSTFVTVLIVYVFLYGRLYLVLGGIDEALATQITFLDNQPLQVALASQSFVQLGFMMTLPMMMEIGLERGFRTALSEFILMQLHLSSIFFTFSVGTKSHYYGKTLLHGGAEYRATGRGFVVFHAKFAENYRLYSRSHFVKAIELMILLVTYGIFGRTYRNTAAYISVTASIWFMVSTWLLAPFVFNPSGFEWQKIVDDWADWNKWISNDGGAGVAPEKSWESWWEKELEHLQYTGKCGVIVETLLASRFFIYQCGLIYRLSLPNRTKGILAFGASWIVILAILLIIRSMLIGRQKYRTEFQLIFRMIKGLAFVAVLILLITLLAIPKMSVRDMLIYFLAFMPTGWGLLLIAQVCRPLVQRAGLWGTVKALARAYDIAMGLVIFFPVALLAWFPFVSEIQTRILFNQAFGRGLQISRILGGQKQKFPYSSL